MLINLSGDAEVLDELAKDDKFLGIIFGLLVVCDTVRRDFVVINNLRTLKNPTPT